MNTLPQHGLVLYQVSSVNGALIVELQPKFQPLPGSNITLIFGTGNHVHFRYEPPSPPEPGQAAPAESDHRTFLKTIHGEQAPDPTHYRTGWDAHAAGTPFSEGPRPLETFEAISWRLGWNDRALAQ